MMHDSDTDLATILLDLIGFFNSPRQDDALLKAASVQLDRALFPLLLRIGTMGPLNVAELAELVGRDPSTVSRQVAKLEGWRLVERVGGEDRRTRAARRCERHRPGNPAVPTLELRPIAWVDRR